MFLTPTRHRYPRYIEFPSQVLRLGRKGNSRALEQPPTSIPRLRCEKRLTPAACIHSGEREPRALSCPHSAHEGLHSRRLREYSVHRDLSKLEDWKYEAGTLDRELPRRVSVWRRLVRSPLRCLEVEARAQPSCQCVDCQRPAPRSARRDLVGKMWLSYNLMVTISTSRLWVLRKGV